MNRTCKKCGIEKPLEEFQKDKNCTHGRTWSCQECRRKYELEYFAKHKTRYQEYHRDWYAKKQGPGYVRTWGRKKSPEELAAFQERKKLRSRELALQKTFGVTLEMYAVMLASQDGRCAICREEPSKKKSLAVDHCHKTGANRGLLCARCNTSIGQFEDSPAMLRAAADYLEKHGDHG